MDLIKIIPENNRLERIWKLAQVDFKKRYYNDRLGLVWALINPIFKVIIYYLVFSLFFKVEQDNFGIYLFSGVIVWSFFTEATSGGMRLLKRKLYLIESIPFQWIDIYYSNMLSILFGFFFNASALIIIGIFSGVFSGIHLFLLPIALAMLFLFTMGIQLVVSVVFPFVEDLDHLWDMALLLGFWGSGVVVNSDIIIQAVPWIIYLNPMIGLIEFFRNAIMGTPFIGYDFLMIIVFQTAIYFGLGIFIFKRMSIKAIEKL
jgi:ABC-type polysaccharide/polyol phosphate export permease